MLVTPGGFKVREQIVRSWRGQGRVGEGRAVSAHPHWLSSFLHPDVRVGGLYSAKERRSSQQDGMF